ncbi:MAG: hypothetical protein DRP65_11710 [Planctomycetota bacterium]|nr:MAG: hypothetical protein DRP65_11710 [Planctomycetota bacterium]
MPLNNRPLQLTPLGAGDIADHRKHLGFESAAFMLRNGKPIPEHRERYELEQRFRKTFGRK